MEAATSTKANTYTSIPSGVYALKRDFNASTRSIGLPAIALAFDWVFWLTAQHYLWKDALQFNLHPSIPLGTGSNVKVADVATGNSIWLLDLARDLPPTTQLDGFDVSLDQCPPSPWLPANVDLHTWNIFEDPPSEFIEAFDVVHIRLITVAIKNDDPRPVLANLRKLLKPQGYLQWDEVDSVDWTIKSTHASLPTDALKCLFQQLCGTDSWKRTMVKTLEENGFSNSQLHRYEYDTAMARLWSDV
ncbi:MAG: hypothetical protein M1818_007048 [Claussenomyces sp. TS43310]|nr:MAG: hypothetical protein M1818_007048 [Claussenomyces sp. TS43310]